MEQQIRQHIQQTCDEQGVFLIEVAIHGSGRSRIIRIVLDTETGITLNQCEELSREFADIFFRKNVFGGEYRLEVTSPGVEKPLESDYEFKRNIGRSLKVEYLDKDESKTAIGTLKKYDNGTLALESPTGEILIAHEAIVKANVKLKW